MSTLTTVTKTWAFSTTGEGWQMYANGPSEGRSITYLLRTGNPPGSLQARYRGGPATDYISARWYGSWVSLGVPSGRDIVGVKFVSGKSMCSLYRGGVVGVSDFAMFVDRPTSKDMVMFKDYTRFPTRQEDEWAPATGNMGFVPYRADSDEWACFYLEWQFRIDGEYGDVAMLADEITIEIQYSTSETRLPKPIYREPKRAPAQAVYPLRDPGIPSPLSSRIDLLITGTAPNNSLPLLIAGHESITSSIPLYTQGTPGTPSQPVPLYIHGYAYINSQTPLVIVGIPALYHGSMPLFMKCPTTISKPTGLNLSIRQSTVIAPFHSSVPLSIRGTQGIQKQGPPLPLFIAGFVRNYSESLNLFLQNTHSAISGTLPLVIGGSDHGNTSERLNLWIKGGNPPLDKWCPLIICNNHSFIEDPWTTLFIKGDGVNPDFLPASESIHLWIKGDPDSLIQVIPIDYPKANATIPLHIVGAIINNNEIPLYIEGLGGEYNGSITLFVTGVVFQGAQSSTTLVIPKVVGTAADNTTTIYISGFDYNG